MTCDVEFLKEVNDALKDADLLAVVLIKFDGSLEFNKEGHSYRIDLGGWLSSTPLPTVGPDAEGYQFVSIAGPFIGQRLVEITHDLGVYRLEFSEGGILFAGHWPGEARDDHVLLVTNVGRDVPFTWGILD